jgi:tetratricopeptide (TPR) repeat protein
VFILEVLLAFPPGHIIELVDIYDFLPTPRQIMRTTPSSGGTYNYRLGLPLKYFLIIISLFLFLNCEAPSHASKGRDFTVQKNYHQAFIEFQTSINEENDCEGYLGLHDIYLIKGEKEKAREIIEKGIIKFPKAPPLYNARANLYINANQFDEGITDLEKAYKLDMERTFSINFGQKSDWEQCIAFAKNKKADYIKSTHK